MAKVFESLDARLSDLERGIITIETAYKNNLKLVLGEDRKIKIFPSTKDIDREQASLITKIIQGNSDAVSGIAGDPEKTRAILTETQKTLALLYKQWVDGFDLWDRLEKVYRKIFIDDHECITGKQCIDDAIVSCKVCGERWAAQWRDENSTTKT